MKRFNHSILLGLALIAVSAVSYTFQVLVFHRTTDTFFYMVQDFAFVPIQVLLVSLVINDLLKRREKAALQHKMNMVIGAFFTEVGDRLLKSFSGFDGHNDQMRQIALVRGDWTNRDFATARNCLCGHDYAMDCALGDLAHLKSFLLDQRAFVLGLLGNPNLLEHESFTDLLWAVSHVTEELAFRSDLASLPRSDYAHIAGDIRRAYCLLTQEWLSYVNHLRNKYPYMFSLVVRTNPFDPQASVQVTEDGYA